jgi:ATP-dependent helicase IRC3
MTDTHFTKSGNSPPVSILRPYQRASLDAVLDRYAAGVRRQLIAMPTGSGKTVCFANLPSLLKDILPGQIMVIAHRKELLDQAAAKISHWNPTLTVSVEQADRFADANADIIVASIATLGRKGSKRRTRFDWDNITTLIVDEAHHSPASTYQTLLKDGGFLDADSSKLLLGYTATPNRADGTPLAKTFDEIVFSYPLRQCIVEGWLSDITCLRVVTKTSLDKVAMTLGDFEQAQLADTVNNPERNKMVTNAWMKHGAGRQTIVFAVDIQHAMDLAGMFRACGVLAEAVWGDDPQRAEKLAAHAHGDIQVLTNCGVLIEGYDDPEVSCILMARPTASTLLFQQMIGRGTRLEAGVNNRLTHPTPLRKKNCLIIDVMDLTTRHEIASIPTLFGISPQVFNIERSVIGTLKKIEDVQREYPQLDLSKITDLEHLDEYIAAHSLWGITFVPEVIANSELIWFPAPDGYAISLANRGRATIKKNLLGKFEVGFEFDGMKIAGVQGDLASAFQSVDATIEQECGDIARLLQQDQAWHADVA